MEKALQNIADYELIQRFFDFELNEEELAAVEARMETDDAFFERMRIYKQMELGLEEVKSGNVQEAKEINLPIKKSNRFTFNRMRSIAAALVLLVGAVFAFWLFSKSSADPSVLAQTYWDDSEFVSFSNLRTSEQAEDTESILVEASNLFDNENYDEVRSKLSVISTIDSFYHKAALLLGESYFEQANYEPALAAFQAVIEHPNREYNDVAYWYQALTYLKLGKLNEAKNNLNYIIEQKYGNAVKARELLEQLE